MALINNWTLNNWWPLTTKYTVQQITPADKGEWKLAGWKECKITKKDGPSENCQNHYELVAGGRVWVDWRPLADQGGPREPHWGLPHLMPPVLNTFTLGPFSISSVGSFHFWARFSFYLAHLTWHTGRGRIKKPENPESSPHDAFKAKFINPPC